LLLYEAGTASHLISAGSLREWATAQEHPIERPTAAGGAQYPRVFPPDFRPGRS
jgi:hypothetical protein